MSDVKSGITLFVVVIVGMMVVLAVVSIPPEKTTICANGMVAQNETKAGLFQCVSLPATPSVKNYFPSNKLGLSQTTNHLLGLNMSFTPASSSVEFQMQFTGEETGVSPGNYVFTLYYGTGRPCPSTDSTVPTNYTAIGKFESIDTLPTSNTGYPSLLIGLATGLTPNTTYCFDMAYRQQSGTSLNLVRPYAIIKDVVP